MREKSNLNVNQNLDSTNQKESPKAEMPSVTNNTTDTNTDSDKDDST